MSLRPGWLWPHTRGPAPSGGRPSGQRGPGPDEGGWLGWGHVLHQQAQGLTTKARHPASLAEGPSARGPVLLLDTSQGPIFLGGFMRMRQVQAGIQACVEPGI